MKDSLNNMSLDDFIDTYVNKDTRPYYFWRKVSSFLAHFLYRPIFYGLENIPEEGPFILASNHCHLPDSGFLLISTPKVVRFLAKKELHDSLMGPIYKAACTIPVDRKNGARNSLAAGEEVLRRGGIIGIYPEGTRNRHKPGELLPFKYGAVKMAASTGAKIVPVALISKARPFIDRYRIVIGTPYQISADADIETENEKLRQKIYELLHRFDQTTITGGR